MSPEMDPYWLLKELDQFPTRPQDRFAISEEDKRIYREELFPYWEKRSMKDFINGQMTDEVKAATSTQIFSINQTDKGQGHIIIDYPRLLNHGLGELVACLLYTSRFVTWQAVAVRSYPVNRKPYRERGNGPDCGIYL